MDDLKLLRFLIVDDHDIVRMGLTVFLETLEHLMVIGEATTGLEAVELAKELHPDVILMDVQMPILDGITATRRIKEAHPTIHILILSADASDKSIQAALDAGADAYVLKNDSVEKLVEAIKTIQQSFK